MSQAEYFATPDLDFSFPTRLGIVQQVAVSPAAVAKGKGVRSAMNPSFGDIYDLPEADADYASAGGDRLQ